MRTNPTDNWLKRAQQGEMAQAVQQAAEVQQAGQGQTDAQQATQGVQQAAQQVSQQQAQQTKGQQVQDKQQSNRANMMAAIQVVANDALPYLNQSLSSIANSILARSDIGANPDGARRLAVELVGAWVSASASGQVSDMSSSIARSNRIAALVNQ